MDAKKWWKSKSIWAGVAAVVLGGLQYAGLVTPEQAEKILTVLAGMGIISLRLGDRPIQAIKK